MSAIPYLAGDEKPTPALIDSLWAELDRKLMILFDNKSPFFACQADMSFNDRGHGSTVGQVPTMIPGFKAFFVTGNQPAVNGIFNRGGTAGYVSFGQPSDEQMTSPKLINKTDVVEGQELTRTGPPVSDTWSLCEIIVEGQTTVSIPAKWDRYNFFRIHNLWGTAITVTFTNTDATTHAVSVPPWGCQCVRRDRKAMTNPWVFTDGYKMFNRVLDGDPRSWVMFSGGRYEHANNVVNVWLGIAWCEKAINGTLAAGCRAFEDQSEWCDMGKHLAKHWAALNTDGTVNADALLADLFYHVGEIHLIDKVTHQRTITKYNGMAHLEELGFTLTPSDGTGYDTGKLYPNGCTRMFCRGKDVVCVGTNICPQGVNIIDPSNPLGRGEHNCSFAFDGDVGTAIPNKWTAPSKSPQALAQPITVGWLDIDGNPQSIDKGESTWINGLASAVVGSPDSVRVQDQLDVMSGSQITFHGVTPRGTAMAWETDIPQSFELLGPVIGPSDGYEFSGSTFGKSESWNCFDVGLMPVITGEVQPPYEWSCLWSSPSKPRVYGSLKFLARWEGGGSQYGSQFVSGQYYPSFITGSPNYPDGVTSGFGMKPIMPGGGQVATPWNDVQSWVRATHFILGQASIGDNMPCYVPVDWLGVYLTSFTPAWWGDHRSNVINNAALLLESLIFGRQPWLLIEHYNYVAQRINRLSMGIPLYGASHLGGAMLVFDGNMIAVNPPPAGTTADLVPTSLSLRSADHYCDVSYDGSVPAVFTNLGVTVSALSDLPASLASLFADTVDVRSFVRTDDGYHRPITGYVEIENTARTDTNRSFGLNYFGQDIYFAPSTLTNYKWVKVEDMQTCIESKGWKFAFFDVGMSLNLVRLAPTVSTLFEVTWPDGIGPDIQNLWPKASLAVDYGIANMRGNVDIGYAFDVPPYYFMAGIPAGSFFNIGGSWTRPPWVQPYLDATPRPILNWELLIHDGTPWSWSHHVVDPIGHRPLGPIQVWQMLSLPDGDPEWMASPSNQPWRLQNFNPDIEVTWTSKTPSTNSPPQDPVMIVTKFDFGPHSGVYCASLTGRTAKTQDQLGAPYAKVLPGVLIARVINVEAKALLKAKPAAQMPSEYSATSAKAAGARMQYGSQAIPVTSVTTGEDQVIDLADKDFIAAPDNNAYDVVVWHNERISLE